MTVLYENITDDPLNGVLVRCAPHYSSDGIPVGLELQILGVDQRLTY